MAIKSSADNVNHGEAQWQIKQARTGLQNKSKRRLDCDTAAGGVQQGADLIVTKAFVLLLVEVEEGTPRIFPMLLTVARLSLSLSSSSP